MQDINSVLLKMKELCPQDRDYEYYWSIVINKYDRLIRKIIGNTALQDDFYNECIVKLPDIIDDFDPDKSSFSTYLTIRLRGHIQQLWEKQSLIGFNKRADKYRSKKNNKQERNLQIIEFNGAHKDIKVTKPTVETDLIVEETLDNIQQIENGEIWIDYKFNNLTLKEISYKYKISRVTARTLINEVHIKVQEKYKNWFK